MPGDVNGCMVTVWSWTDSVVFVGQFSVFTEDDFGFGHFDDTTTFGTSSLIVVAMVCGGEGFGQLTLFDDFHIV